MHKLSEILAEKYYLIYKEVDDIVTPYFRECAEKIKDMHNKYEGHFDQDKAVVKILGLSQVEKCNCQNPSEQWDCKKCNPKRFESKNKNITCESLKNCPDCGVTFAHLKKLSLVEKLAEHLMNTAPTSYSNYNDLAKEALNFLEKNK